MNVKLQMSMESDEGDTLVTEIATIERGAPSSGTLGLSIAESKDARRGMQQALVNHQVAVYADGQR